MKERTEKMSFKKKNTIKEKLNNSDERQAFLLRTKNCFIFSLYLKLQNQSFTTRGVFFEKNEIQDLDSYIVVQRVRKRARNLIYFTFRSS